MKHACIIMSVLSTTTLFAQTQPPNKADESLYVPTMTFDVASVRQSQVDVGKGFTVGGGFSPRNSSTLRLTNFDIWNLLGFAYEANRSQIEAVPKDFRYALFNVEARSDAATDEKLAKLPKEEQQIEQEHMIQVLLAERFNLKAHWETRQGQTFDLVVSKAGRLQTIGAPPSADELKVFGDRPIPPLYQSGSSARGFEYIAHGASTADIAAMLTQQFGHPVNDKTSLNGKYDFDLKYYQTRSDERKDDETNPWAPLEAAIQDQLGVKLVKTQGPTRVLVIDHIEMPSAN